MMQKRNPATIKLYEATMILFYSTVFFRQGFYGF